MSEGAGMNDEQVDAATEATTTEGTGNPLKDRVIAALKTCYDPEIPVDIWELGLIYEVSVAEDSAVSVKMTLTSPACPVAGSLPGEVEAKVREVEGVTGATVELVWDPPWTPELMSEPARVELGFF